MKSSDRRIQINGRDCTLTRMEYDVYQWMRQHRGIVVTRASLLRNVWGYPGQADTRTVDMCVRRLRTKVGAGAIQTIYGKGYIWKL